MGAVWESQEEFPEGGHGNLLHRMCLSTISRKSTPPQNLQLNVLISSGEQLFDDFVGELTFYD